MSVIVRNIIFINITCPVVSEGGLWEELEAEAEYQVSLPFYQIKVEKKCRVKVKEGEKWVMGSERLKEGEKWKRK